MRTNCLTTGFFGAGGEAITPDMLITYCDEKEWLDQQGSAIQPHELS